MYYTIRLNHGTPVVRRSYNKIARIRHYYQITAEYPNIFFSCVSVLCLRIYFQCLKTLFFFHSVTIFLFIFAESDLRKCIWLCVTYAEELFSTCTLNVTP